MLSDSSHSTTDQDANGSLAARYLAELQADTLQLPVLPAVIGEVLRLCEAPETTGAKLSQRIQSDPALAGNLLRIANSAAYRGAIEVVSLNQAINRLGFATIRDISLSVALSSLAASLGSFAAEAERLSRRSLATALWSRAVARSCRKHVEDAYLCGLLRNVGSMLILRWLSDQSMDLAPAALAEFKARCERDAGQRLVGAWELPPVVGAILAQNPLELEPKTHYLWWVVELAGALAAEESPQQEALLETPAVGALNLYPEDLAELLAQTEVLQAQLAELCA